MTKQRKRILITVITLLMVAVLPAAAQTWDPDVVPASPSAYDTEFDSYPTWGNEFIGAGVDSAVTSGGQLEVSLNGSSWEGYIFTQDVIGYSTPFVVDTKVGVVSPGNDRIGIGIRDSDQSNFYQHSYDFTSGEVKQSSINPTTGEVPGGGTFSKIAAAGVQYLRVYVTGSSAETYYSSDGINWTQGYTHTDITGSDYDVGVIVAHYGSNGTTAQFDFLRVRQTSDPTEPVYGQEDDGTATATPTPSPTPTPTPEPTPTEEPPATETWFQIEQVIDPVIYERLQGNPVEGDLYFHTVPDVDAELRVAQFDYRTRALGTDPLTGNVAGKGNLRLLSAAETGFTVSDVSSSGGWVTSSLCANDSGADNVADATNAGMTITCNRTGDKNLQGTDMYTPTNEHGINTRFEANGHAAIDQEFELTKITWTFYGVEPELELVKPIPQENNLYGDREVVNNAYSYSAEHTSYSIAKENTTVYAGADGYVANVYPYPGTLAIDFPEPDYQIAHAYCNKYLGDTANPPCMFIHPLQEAFYNYNIYKFAGSIEEYESDPDAHFSIVKIETNEDVTLFYAVNDPTVTTGQKIGAHCSIGQTLRLEDTNTDDPDSTGSSTIQGVAVGSQNNNSQFINLAENFTIEPDPSLCTVNDNEPVDQCLLKNSYFSDGLENWSSTGTATASFSGVLLNNGDTISQTIDIKPGNYDLSIGHDLAFDGTDALSYPGTGTIDATVTIDGNTFNITSEEGEYPIPEAEFENGTYIPQVQIPVTVPEGETSITITLNSLSGFSSGVFAWKINNICLFPDLPEEDDPLREDFQESVYCSVPVSKPATLQEFGKWLLYFWNVLESFFRCTLMPILESILDVILDIGRVIGSLFSVFLSVGAWLISFFINTVKWFFSDLFPFLGGHFRNFMYQLGIWLSGLDELIYVAGFYAQELIDTFLIGLRVAGNLLSKGLGFISSAVSNMDDLFNAYQNAQPEPIPYLPDCKNAPMDSDVCAVYYVLDNTLFSGTFGAAIPFAMSTIINIIITLKSIDLFIRLARVVRNNIGSS